MKCAKVVLGVFVLVSMVWAGDIVVDGGLNLSNFALSGDYEQLESGNEKSMKVGFAAGVKYKQDINEQIGVAAGLGYETRGSVIKSSSGGVDAELSFNLAYLQIPVLFSFSPMPALSINAGPEIGLNLANKSKMKIGDTESEDDSKEDTNPLDVGLTAGLDYMVAEMIVVGGAYTLGFMNLDKEDDSTTPAPEGAIKNTNIKLKVGYLIKM